MSGFNPTPSRIRQAVSAYSQNTRGGSPLSTAVSSLQAPSALQLGATSLAAAPASAAAPVQAAPTAQPLPFDPVYQGTVNNNTTRLNQTLASIQNSRNTNLTDAGYVESGGGFALDPSNPFSRAALLQRHYDQSVAGSTNSLAAQGQLYSGALQNAQNENRFQFDAGTNSNLRSLQDALAALADRRTGAIADASDSNTAALGTSISNAQNQANIDRDFNAQQAANAAQAPTTAASSPTPAAGFTHVNTVAGSPRFGQSYRVEGRTHIYADGTRVTV